MIERLRESGAIPGETANGVKGADSAKKKKRADKGVLLAPVNLDARERDC